MKHRDTAMTILRVVLLNIYTYISYIYSISMSVAGGAGVRAGGHIQAWAAAQWRLQGAR